jgi:hypothetical protein
MQKEWVPCSEVHVWSQGEIWFELSSGCRCKGSFFGLEMLIVFPGSTSDCLAFEGSLLFKRLEDGLLLQRLCLFGGDNAYINSQFMETPFSGWTS